MSLDVLKVVLKHGTSDMATHIRNGNNPLHSLLQGLYFFGEGNDNLERARLLVDAGCDVLSHNAECATPLKLALEKTAGDIVSYLLLNGAKFSDVKYIGTIGLGWATEMPWYPEAIEAKWRDIERGSLTAADVLRVYYMLQRLGFSKDVTANVLELAEYWACRSITYEGVRVRKRQPQPLAFPLLPPGVPTSSIRRIGFWVKSDEDIDEETFHSVIQ
ncbi:hypothetical protein BU15DRAFT_84394, partial [Melanogaster broomeanus]